MKQTGFKNSPAPSNTRAIPGAVFNFLATGKETNNEFALMLIEVQKGNEPPEHTHKNEDECYYILEGEINFWIGKNLVNARAGDFVFLPKNVPHKFELISDVVKELMWIAPAGLEKWFWDNSAPSPDMQPLPQLQGPPPPEMMEKFVSSLSSYGVEMV